MLFVGDGPLLHQVLRTAKEESYSIHIKKWKKWAEPLHESDLHGVCCAVSFSGGARIGPELKLQQLCRQSGVSYLHTRIDGHLGFIGPLVLPERPGCLVCMHERRLRVLGNTHRELLERLTDEGEYPQNPPFLQQLADILLQELQGLLLDKPLMFRQRVYVLSGDRLMGKIHRFQPVSDCVECSPIPDDTKESARLRLRPRVKSARNNDRAAKVDQSISELREQLFDWRMGVVSHIYRARNSTAIPLVAAEVPMERTDNRESGIGRTLTFEQSQRISLLEALERIAGGYPQGKRTSVRGSYRRLREDAVDPARFGLHHPDVVRRSDYPLVPYHPDLECNWVWAYSFLEQRPVLVPEQTAYYRLHHNRPALRQERFLYEISNGCALGGSLEEAILHGLFEVIERDSFLLSWYGRLSRTEIEWEGIERKEILMFRDRVERLGYRVHCFDITSETGIPAVWVIAVNPTDNGVKTYSASAAHFDAEKAIFSALVEVGTSLEILSDKWPNMRGKALNLLKHEEKIRTIEDHVLLYSLPEAYHRFHFLFNDNRRSKKLSGVYPGRSLYRPSMNLTDDLRYLIGLITTKLKLDVIVVDQTTPLEKKLGMRSVKVLVPGTLSMTFGALLHRTYGIERLLSVPYEMGYWEKKKSYEELVILPHPFP